MQPVFNDKYRPKLAKPRNPREEYLGYLEEIYNFQENPKFATAKGETNYYSIQKDFIAQPYPKDFNPLKEIVDINISTYDGPEILTVGIGLK